MLSVPVGDGYLGRVVDPLGNPIDGLAGSRPKAVVFSRPRHLTLCIVIRLTSLCPPA